MTRVLLIGGAGQLGTAIVERWDDCDVAAPSRDELDLTDGRALRDAIEALRPEVMVNAAAFHDVDRCEDEPDRAFAVNAVAVRKAAALARERELCFVTISTDYVFDGAARSPYAEDAPPHPLSVYGASKLAGEYLVESLGGRAFVVRSCGLYGKARRRARLPLVERVLQWKPGDAPLRVVNDVIASPTFAGDLAAALRRLISTQSYGLFHAVDAGPVSWYDFACETARQSGNGARIEPIAAADWKARAARPRFSALENAKLARLGIEMPSWRDGIAAYLRERLR